MRKTNITIGHSPDSDDAFMFYPIAMSKIDLHHFNFIHVIESIETLNQKALNSKLDVSAISIHAYPALQQNYAFLSSGASMGYNYGPILVSKNNSLGIKDIKNSKVAVPGKLTSAYLAMRLFQSDFEAVFLPFDKIIDAIKDDDNIDFGIIIHEGQLLYHNIGLSLVLDLGKWWFDKFNLPLPLGANVIKRSIDIKDIKLISNILKNSIIYSLEHRTDAMSYAMQYAGDMSYSLADKFVGMYVNDYTKDFGQDGKNAVSKFLELGFLNGIIKTKIGNIDFY